MSRRFPDPLLERIERRSQRAPTSSARHSFYERALYVLLARDYGIPMRVVTILGLLTAAFLFLALGAAAWNVLGEALDQAREIRWR